MSGQRLGGDLQLIAECARPPIGAHKVWAGRLDRPALIISPMSRPLFGAGPAPYRTKAGWGLAVALRPCTSHVWRLVGSARGEGNQEHASRSLVWHGESEAVCRGDALRLRSHDHLCAGIRPIFLSPTARHAPFGVLPTSDAGKPVVLVETGEVKQTPAATAAPSTMRRWPTSPSPPMAAPPAQLTVTATYTRACRPWRLPVAVTVPVRGGAAIGGDGDVGHRTQRGPRRRCRRGLLHLAGLDQHHRLAGVGCRQHAERGMARRGRLRNRSNSGT